MPSAVILYPSLYMDIYNDGTDLDSLVEMQMSTPAQHVIPQPVSEKSESEVKSQPKPEVKSQPKSEASPDDVLIHIRFHPNADIAWIGAEPPAHVSPQDLYIRLRMEAYDYYRGLAGGRGFFRIPRAVYDDIVSKM
jgi:hypothetical protein